MSTAKKIQVLQAPVASFVCELFSFSTVKVRVMAPLNRIACLFLSLQFSLIHCDSVTCIYPLQYTLTHPFILVSHTARPTLMRWGSYYVLLIKLVTISKESNQQFSVGMDDMLETDQTFASNISQLFINACKLQLRVHT